MRGLVEDGFAPLTLPLFWALISLPGGDFFGEEDCLPRSVLPLVEEVGLPATLRGLLTVLAADDAVGCINLADGPFFGLFFGNGRRFSS